MTENWLPVVGYEGCYEVSDLGRVRSISRRIRRQFTKRGYKAVTLSKGNRLTFRTVHTLVLEAFVGPRPPGMECCHYDSDRANNALTNLRWDTRGANRRDTVRNGRHQNARKTRCDSGHRFTPENTYTRKDGGYRQCRECMRVANRKARAKQEITS